MRLILLIYSILLSLGALAETKEPVASSQWSFQAYLQQYLQKDEAYLQAQLNTKQTTASNQSFFDLYQNTLTLQPSWNETKQDSSFGVFQQDRFGVEGSINQSTPLGTNISLSAFKFLDDPDPTLGGLDMQYEWSLEQPLWRDSFGVSSRTFRKAAEATIKGASYAEQQSLMENCLEAAKAYLDSFVRQEQKALREQIFSDSQKALSIARRGYNRKVLRKIDFLAARADFLKVKADLLTDRLLYDQAMSAFYTRISTPTASSNLVDPSSFFAQVPVPKAYDAERVIRLLQSREETQASELNYKATKSNSRSAVNLGVSGRHVETLGATAAAAGSFNQNQTDSIQVFLRFELPLINKTLRGDTQSRFYQWKISQLTQQRLEKDLKIQFRQLHLEQDKVRSEIAITNENEKIKRQQLREADRLLKSGKIEFADYVRYRDSFYLEKQKLITLRSTLWQGAMQLAQYGSQLGSYCRGGQSGSI